MVIPPAALSRHIRHIIIHTNPRVTPSVRALVCLSVRSFVRPHFPILASSTRRSQCPFVSLFSSYVFTFYGVFFDSFLVSHPRFSIWSWFLVLVWILVTGSSFSNSNPDVFSIQFQYVFDSRFRISFFSHLPYFLVFF